MKTGQSSPPNGRGLATAHIRRGRSRPGSFDADQVRLSPAARARWPRAGRQRPSRSWVAPVRCLTGISNQGGRHFLYSEPAVIPQPPPGSPGRARVFDWDDVGLIRHLESAIQNGFLVFFRYWGGSTPGALRIVEPIRVFPLYEDGPPCLLGRDLVREVERTFRLDRMNWGAVRFWIE